MARDYKSRAHPRPKKKQTPGWIWFITGLMVGLFAAGLAWLKLAPPTGEIQRPQPAAAQPKQEPPRPQKRAQTPSEKPRFEFYTVLPEMEVVVPQPEPESEPRKDARKPSSAATSAKRAGSSGTAYMLQMGSFRKYEDADRMKASLALLGIEAEIQKVSINNQDIFHRVRSGPYHNSQQVNQLRARLQQNKINTLLIKLKK